MQKFGRVTFDFDNNCVRLGQAWIRGAEITLPVRVRVVEKTIITPRAEIFILVKYNAKTGFLEGYFDPVTIAGMAGSTHQERVSFQILWVSSQSAY